MSKQPFKVNAASLTALADRWEGYNREWLRPCVARMRQRAEELRQAEGDEAPDLSDTHPLCGPQERNGERFEVTRNPTPQPCDLRDGGICDDAAAYLLEYEDGTASAACGPCLERLLGLDEESWRLRIRLAIQGPAVREGVMG